MHKIKSMYKLMRFREYFLSIIIITLFGVKVANGVLDWRIPILLCGNLLATAFCFMFNDVEDAYEDSLNEKKVKRNPVSAKEITRKQGYVASFAVAFASLVSFYFLGYFILFLGVINIIISFLYSWKVIRLKAIPVLDLVSHGTMYGLLQFLTAYFCYATELNIFMLLGIIPMLTSIISELAQELRDYETDSKTNILTSAIFLGKRATIALVFLLGFTLLGILFYLFWTQYIPISTLFSLIFLPILFIKPVFSAIKKENIVEMSNVIFERIKIIVTVSVVIWFL